ncbi:hypothetical protein DCCM_4721 [Desulfocucumis palustris]|uniref:Uncharacterized protein n=1 Tax=Desulfocucumis palustris TaxID=1898651 RepID=A0A2L2XHI6_9FIRM|nr:hypothetical protein DCCM_4721 [Desulfocucumis palustris]
MYGNISILPFFREIRGFTRRPNLPDPRRVLKNTLKKQ